MRRAAVLSLMGAILLGLGQLQAEAQGQVKVRISWGHESPSARPFRVKLVSDRATISDATGQGLESGDSFKDGVWKTEAGAGDVDGAEFTLHYPETRVEEIEKLHPIWATLIGRSDADTARRLRCDPAYRHDPRKLTVEMSADGTKGFSLTVDQLLQNEAFWAPSLDVYVTCGESPVGFADHQSRLLPWRGKRILDRIHHEPEATYEQYTGRWEDMGNPAYVHPYQPPPGHIVCLTWDSAIHKFGIDRGAGVRNDLGNPDRFRFWFDLGELSPEIAASWKGQELADGLPVMTTVFEKDGVRYEVEQFAYPLNGPPEERRGDIPMVLFQKVRLTELEGKPRGISVRMYHSREVPAPVQLRTVPLSSGGAFLLEESASHRILLCVEGVAVVVRLSETTRAEAGKTGEKEGAPKRSGLTASLSLPENGSAEFVAKLPSPAVSTQDRARLLELEFAAARAATLKFWSDCLARGARFQVPEKAVNDLFRANLWHALRLPRRHGGQQPTPQIDLPYSNFAYGQTGIPWPVNHAVYVDYMIYDLRGYHDIAAEELAAIFRANQEPNGHIKGYANWLVYTPSTLYAVAKNYLLSQDGGAFEQLLPSSLRAMDWCLREVREAKNRSGMARGLVHGPLNDGTGNGYWAFNQAYMFAGLDLFGTALRQHGHPRAAECLSAARDLQKSVERAYRFANVRSPLVQLRDHTWIPYVPCEATRFGRLFDQWYPTDVDTGAVHLLRLKAVPADGDLADSLLNDHEDNLFLHGWGMANEPVYNPHATAYLLRDDPKAAVRTFYSMMACAFSHSVYEPVEHRWAHGQYFGPPSTDGAWAELYRNMLIRELDDGGLLLFSATPRNWLEDRNAIEIERAPTYFGELSARMESHANTGRISAEIQMPTRAQPKALLVRFRHPRAASIQSVAVNGQAWKDFDVRKEWVRIEKPTARRYSIVAEY